jgi:hypothetical protein
MSAGCWSRYWSSKQNNHLRKAAPSVAEQQLASTRTLAPSRNSSATEILIFLLLINSFDSIHCQFRFRPRFLFASLPRKPCSLSQLDENHERSTHSSNPKKHWNLGHLTTYPYSTQPSTKGIRRYREASKQPILSYPPARLESLAWYPRRSAFFVDRCAPSNLFVRIGIFEDLLASASGTGHVPYHQATQGAYYNRWPFGCW